MLELLQYTFVQKAVLASLLAGGVCAALGLFLVLRNLSLIGDGLAHFNFGAATVGLSLGILPLYVALPASVIGAAIIIYLERHAKVLGDAAIGVISSVGLAVGVLILSLSGGLNVDVFSYLFGNLLSVSVLEIWILALIAIALTGFMIRYYRDLVAVTVDEDYARTLGVHTTALDAALTVFTALTIVLATRAAGVMLVSALIILPPLTALNAFKTFRNVLFASVGFGLVSALLGFGLSLSLNLPAGATIVLVNFVFLVITLVKSKWF